MAAEYLASVSGVGPRTGGRASSAGALRGEEILRARTHLDSVSLNLAAVDLKNQEAALGTAIQQAAAIDRLTRQLQGFGENYLEKAKRITDLGAEALNTPIRSLGPKFLSNPDVREYMLALNALQRTYATITVGGAQSKGQLPVTASEHVDKLLNPNVTLGEATAEVSQLKSEVNVDAKALRDQQGDIKNLVLANPIAQALGGDGGTDLPKPAKRGELGSKEVMQKYRDFYGGDLKKAVKAMQDAGYQ
jgi:hypothetical protein